MKDRLTPGLMAGVIGAIVQIVYGRIIISTGFSQYAFTDFGQILILGTHKKGLLPFFIGSMTHIILGAMMGVVLSYVLNFTSSRFYLLKGIGIGLSIYVFAFASGVYFKMPVVNKASPNFAITVLIGSTIFGLVSAYSLKIITNNFRQYFGEENEVQPKPKIIKLFIPQPARKIEEENIIRKTKIIKPRKL